MANNRYHYDANGKLKSYSSDDPPFKVGCFLLTLLLLGLGIIFGDDNKQKNVADENPQVTQSESKSGRSETEVDEKTPDEAIEPGEVALDETTDANTNNALLPSEPVKEQVAPEQEPTIIFQPGTGE